MMKTFRFNNKKSKFIHTIMNMIFAITAVALFVDVEFVVDKYLLSLSFAIGVLAYTFFFD
jgi:hypothetical protein